MYVRYTDQTLIFPNGAEKTKEELEQNDAYKILFKVPCAVDIVGGITRAYQPISNLAENYNIDPEDPDVISKINSEISKRRTYSNVQMDTYVSVSKLATFLAVNIPDEQAIEVADLYPEFEIGHEYKQNDRFQYGNSLYKVNQDHTSQEQWVPGEVGTESLYTDLMLDESGYQIWKQPTGAHDAYSKGDIVRYNGILYKSLIDSNTWSPDAYPEGWEKYTE